MQLFSLTGDVLIRNSIKKYTRDYLDELYKTGNDIPTNIKDQLTLIAEESILETLKKRLQDAGISDLSIVNQLDSWNNGTLNRLYQITTDPNYVGILNEFVSDVSLLDKFRLVEETWWAKYPMAGMCKRTASTIPTQFKKYIGEIEVTSLGQKLKLKTVSLEETSASYIGKLFDEVVEAKVIDAWKTNNFSEFPSSVSTQLTSLKSQGYELAVEAQVTINGKNPVPDYLLIKGELNPLTNVVTYDVNNVKYIDCKYLWDSPFSANQLEIVNDVSNSGSALTTAQTGIKNVQNVQIVAPNTVVKITSVEKLTVNQQLQMVIQ